MRQSPGRKGVNMESEKTGGLKTVTRRQQMEIQQTRIRTFSSDLQSV